MALASPAIASPRFQVALSRSLTSRLHDPLVGRVWTCPSSASFSVKSSITGPFSVPPKFKARVNYAVKKLCEFIPGSVQNFPWTQAGSAAIQQLLILGQEALKWSLTALFILSSVSDVLYSISRNKELLIPCGLFFGFMAANFLKETSQEFFGNSKERANLLGIGFFFVLVKVIAIYFQQGFLLHAANGGLMQVLWHWRMLLQSKEDNVTTAVH